jgi:cytochrome c oxidase assembly protein subunit 15
MKGMTLYRRLIFAALALCTLVVVVGAYVRLSDAGLGCPDWPGCYGQVTPHHAADTIRETHSANPQGPVSLPKAWKEMIHRYLAGSLGLLIIAIAALAWRHRTREGCAPGCAAALVGVVMFQGALGMWTVTLLLKPAIVTAHLLGGLVTLAMLVWLALRASRLQRIEASRPLVMLTRVGLILLIAQIALGGWTSTNYAALACTDFPTCHGSFWPDMDYANAFHVVRELGMTAAGEHLSLAALTAIHWTHRLGAVVAGGALFMLAWGLSRRRATQALGMALLAAVALQLMLGVANVFFSLPLTLAVAHNAGAALLVGLLVSINYRLHAAEVSAASVRSPHERTERKNSYA